MKKNKTFGESLAPRSLLRKLLLSWLTVVTLQYLLVAEGSRALDGLTPISHISFPITILATGCAFGILWCLSLFFETARTERWAMTGVFAVYSLTAYWETDSALLLLGCGIVLTLLSIYAANGANDRPERKLQMPQTRTKPAILIAAAVALSLCAVVSVWTVYRLKTYVSTTYDFGIFSQMFHSMKTTGLPTTTLERDGALSHFAVHVSPIFYLMLPFYALFPYPATLQVLQAVVLASAVIPFWLIVRNRGFSPMASCLLSCLMLLYPALAGGTSYDLHENVFLTPLLFWVFYFIDKRKLWGIVLCGSLTLMVKEDAAVYVAILGLYLLGKALVCQKEERRWHLLIGGGIVLFSVAYFLTATHYLASSGDGVMTNRYWNLMPDKTGGLFDVIKTVAVLPIKALRECFLEEKLNYILQTMLPLLFLPFLTRRYERLLLLIPYLLLNLVTDYQYQYNIFFQYGFGSAAFLLYASVLNLQDLITAIPKGKRGNVLPAAAAISLGITVVLFSGIALNRTEQNVRRYTNDPERYETIAQMLEKIPEGVPVTASGQYTVPLSNREIVYDLEYTTPEKALSTDYVVIRVKDNYKEYHDPTWREHSYETVCDFFYSNGYTVLDELEDVLIIFHRQ